MAERTQKLARAIADEYQGDASKIWKEARSCLSGVPHRRGDRGRFAFETLNPSLRPWEGWTDSVQVVAADGTVVSAANTAPRLADGG
jgi:hypothetical protein